MTHNQLQYAILGVLIYHGPQTHDDLVAELGALGTTWPIKPMLALLLTEGVVVYTGMSDEPNTNIYRIDRILTETRSK